ncbi:hypothetical protein ACFX13_021891 [Malus domestica]
MARSIRSSVLPVLVKLLLLTWPAIQVVHGQEACTTACFRDAMSCMVECNNSGNQSKPPDAEYSGECSESYYSCMENCPESLRHYQPLYDHDD